MPPELDKMSPEMDMPSGEPSVDMDQPEGEVIGAHGDTDREGAMAKADLLKLASYAQKLSKQIDDDAQLESWVQAKITKAADYMASVYHYLEYEMKFSEYGHHLDNSDTLSEGQKMRIKEMLAEAKDKMKELKKKQAEKMKPVHEGILSGGDRPCTECGGTGMVYEEPKEIPHHVKNKVDKYNKLVKATHAAHKRMDRNHNGVPDDEEVSEEFDNKSKVGDSYKTARKGTVTKTATGIKHEKGDYSDDDHVEPSKKASKAGMTGAERRAQKSQDKEQDKAGKDWEKRFGKGSVTRHTAKTDADNEKDLDEDPNEGNEFSGELVKARAQHKDNFEVDGKSYPVKESKKKVNESMQPHHMAHYHACKCAEAYHQGMLEAAMHHMSECEKHGGLMSLLGGKWHHAHPQIDSGSIYECPMTSMMAESGDRVMTRAAKGVMKYGKDGMKALAKAGKDGKDLDKVRDKYDKYDESAPSAGLSKAKKSAVVKKAKAGGDIGKPGKSFDKVAKSAGGGEKGKKIAAAAMWKNVKEETAYIEEKKAAVKDLPGNQEKIDVDHDGKIEKSDLAKLRAGKKETVKESADFDQLLKNVKRLVG